MERKNRKNVVPVKKDLLTDAVLSTGRERAVAVMGHPRITPPRARVCVCVRVRVCVCVCSSVCFNWDGSNTSSAHESVPFHKFCTSGSDQEFCVFGMQHQHWQGTKHTHTTSFAVRSIPVEFIYCGFFNGTARLDLEKCLDKYGCQRGLFISSTVRFLSVFQDCSVVIKCTKFGISKISEGSVVSFEFSRPFRDSEGQNRLVGLAPHLLGVQTRRT